jgi:hypothetical protein
MTLSWSYWVFMVTISKDGPYPLPSGSPVRADLRISSSCIPPFFSSCIPYFVLSLYRLKSSSFPVSLFMNETLPVHSTGLHRIRRCLS